MDPVLGILLAGVVGFAIGIFVDYRTLKARKALLHTRKKESAPDKTWDEEYLHVEVKKHEIDRIVPTKYWFKSNKSKTYDGYRFYCTCGHTDYRPSLRWAELGFEKHQKDMREAALAQLGRFK